MAQKTIVELIDDLDGTPGDDIDNIEFALDGVTYEIDLNERNAANLRDTLAEFIASARRSGGRIRRGAARPAGDKRSSAENQAIREWAQANGHSISERGRIPAAIIESYEEAQAPAPVKPVRAAKSSKAASKKTKSAKAATAFSG